MKRRRVQPVAPEWSYAVDADQIGGNPVALHIEADAGERAALTRRMDLIALDKLEADLTLTRNRGDLVVYIEGRFKADLTQKCVVSQDPVTEHIEESFEAWFADPAQAVSFAKVRQDRLRSKGQADLPLLEEPEDPEPILDGLIDLGELTAQYLSLAITPYPRAAEYATEAATEEVVPQEPSPGRLNPFAALKEWKIRGRGEND